MVILVALGHALPHLYNTKLSPSTKYRYCCTCNDEAACLLLVLYVRNQSQQRASTVRAVRNQYHEFVRSYASRMTCHPFFGNYRTRWWPTLLPHVPFIRVLPTTLATNCTVVVRVTTSMTSLFTLRQLLQYCST
jgi:hypothetical protein